MTETVSLEAITSAPPTEAILRTQGIPPDHVVPERVIDLVHEARHLYERLVEPRGILADVTAAEFREVYEGDGRNADPTPLPSIVGRAERLALFAATLGEPVCRKINDLFRENDAALACMLDGIASQRADAAATLLGKHFLEDLLEGSEADASTTVLPYSPGYCGWHVSGQRKLFGFLNPGRIGIELNESCLMSPIKSVSGVLVTGPPESHFFANDYDFCPECTTKECRQRIASLTPTRPMTIERSPQWRS